LALLELRLDRFAATAFAAAAAIVSARNPSN
jgi:hypothetical protein